MESATKHGEYITGAVGGIQIRLADLKRYVHGATSITDPDHLLRVKIREIISNTNIDLALRTLSNLGIQLRNVAEAAERQRPTETPEPIDWKKDNDTNNTV